MARTLFCAWAASACLMTLATAADAVPGEQHTVTDVYGKQVTVRDSDDELPKYALIGKAYQAVLYKGNATDVMFGEIRAADYEKFVSDRDLGPFIAVAKEQQCSAIVLVLSAVSDGATHAVFFKGATAVAYGEGKHAKAEDIQHSLVDLPATLPAAPGMEEGGAMRLRPYNVFADNGNALTVFRIMHVGKPEVPWTFGENKPASKQQ